MGGQLCSKLEGQVAKAVGVMSSAYRSRPRPSRFCWFAFGACKCGFTLDLGLQFTASLDSMEARVVCAAVAVRAVLLCMLFLHSKDTFTAAMTPPSW